MPVLKAQIKVESNFEGGNVKILGIYHNTVYFKANYGTRQTANIWFYFKIYGFTKNSMLNLYQAVDQPRYSNGTLAYSYDNKNWHITTYKTENQNFYFYKIPTNSADTIYIALTHPYLYSTLLHFIDSLAKLTYLDTTILTFSEHQRQVPLIIITDSTDTCQSKDMIWLTVRQHAFEVPANFFAEGFISYLTRDDSSVKNFRRNFITYIVPMMDVDNVAEGKTGRMQQPVDFNRDWIDKPHWNAIEATEELLESTSEINNLRIFVDIHSVFPSFPDTTLTFFNIYAKNDEHSDNLNDFFGLFSQLSNLTPNEINDTTSKSYADIYVKKNYPYTDFAVTIEIPWKTGNTAPEKYWRWLGKIFAQTLVEYLTQNYITR